MPGKSAYLDSEIKGLKASIFDSRPDQNISQFPRENTLLIVEDNKELVYYLKSELQEDYKILVAENGEEGFNSAKDELPDLIISDLMMPGIDGIEMCKKLKIQLETCHIPIIILTAKSGSESEKAGLETGADEYLSKPFNMELLKLRIKNLLLTRGNLYNQMGSKSESFVFKAASDKKDKELIECMTGIVKQNVSNSDFSAESFSEMLGMSRSGLYKTLKRITGLSTTEFIRIVKLNEALVLFRQNKFTIEQVTYMVGFSDPKYFRNCFRKIYGKTPSEYIRDLKSSIE
jgi:DNA-binding response OmpR family regulator